MAKDLKIVYIFEGFMATESWECRLRIIGINMRSMLIDAIILMK